MSSKSEWMKPAEAAALMGLTVNSLEGDRRRERPTVPFVKYNERVVRYRRADVEAAIAAHTVGGEAQR